MSAAENKKAQGAQGKEAQVKEDQSINDAAGWAKVRGDWAKEKLAVAEAKADRFFNTDDDLPLSQHLILMFIAAFFVIFVIWANFAALDEVTRGDGKVIPSTEIQKLQSLEGGIVEEFLVREGDEVKAGQVLMRLRDVQASSDLGSNRARYLGLLAKTQRLKAEAEGLPTPNFTEEVMKEVPQSVQEELESFRANVQNLSSQTQVLQQQLNQREQEVTGLRTRVSDLREVLRLSNEERDMIAPLVERGSAPKVELLQLERGIKERQTELNTVMASLTQAQSAVDEAQARIAELTDAAKAQAQTELAATTIEMSSIGETLSGLEDRKVRTEIKAPVDGTIKDILVNTVGGVVQPGADLIEIVPKDDQLIIEARVRPSDIAFLHPNQPAVVKITAYDFSIYGGLKGEVIDISADTLTNEEGETFYRVRVRTNETSLTRKDEVLNIIPGMVASVDILTGEKTVMQYILKPLVKTLDNAMNER
ncbi:MAG TPA: HlyD family type I secretion periplasmic adaptor subunit [Micavibrio sp.]|nr:HlyD family type I secretion periplasmic adaptor subunit [Pseudomonadota bacterium]HIF25156.1 HlyD family type I secretion periplasmic adaptor subunit [Micavibrio sp.]